MLTWNGIVALFSEECIANLVHVVLLLHLVVSCTRTLAIGSEKRAAKQHLAVNYASRRSRTRDTVKLTVCVCVSVPAVTAQWLQCDENYRLLATFSWILIRGFAN